MRGFLCLDGADRDATNIACGALMFTRALFNLCLNKSEAVLWRLLFSCLLKLITAFAQRRTTLIEGRAGCKYDGAQGKGTSHFGSTQLGVSYAQGMASPKERKSGAGGG